MIRTLESMLKKLKEYESLEEQGRLVRLPCALGGTLYHIRWNDNHERIIVPFQLVEGNMGSVVSLFGKTVFLTKSEAEKALEMEVPK